MLGKNLKGCLRTTKFKEIQPNMFLLSVIFNMFLLSVIFISLLCK